MRTFVGIIYSLGKKRRENRRDAEKRRVRRVFLGEGEKTAETRRSAEYAEIFGGGRENRRDAEKRRVRGDFFGERKPLR
jgi:hypothetical protein